MDSQWGMALLGFALMPQKIMKTTVMVSEANHLTDIAMKYDEIPPSGQDDMGFR